MRGQRAKAHGGRKRPPSSYKVPSTDSTAMVSWAQDKREREFFPWPHKGSDSLGNNLHLGLCLNLSGSGTLIKKE